MKTLTVPFFILIVFLAVLPVSLAADLKDGFLDLEWGASIGEKSGYSEIGRQDEVAYYTPSDRQYKVLDQTVEDIKYGFFNDKFFAVFIDVKSDAVFGEMRRYITDKYGIPKKTFETKNEIVTYRWKYKDTKLKLKYYQKTYHMKLAIYYTPLSNQVNTARQEAFVEQSQSRYPLSGAKQKRAIEEWNLINF